MKNTTSSPPPNPGGGGVSLGQVKDELVTPPRSSFGGESGTGAGHGGGLGTPPDMGTAENMFLSFGASPPVFSMDALNDVLGQFITADDEDTQFFSGMEVEDVEQKFVLEDISNMEEKAESAAAALFSATQSMNMSEMMNFPEPPATPVQQQQYHYRERRIREAPCTAVRPPPAIPSTSSFLPQLEHPLFESLFSPLDSPIYPRVVEHLKDKKDGWDGSSDSNSEGCSDSEFEIDKDSSDSSDDSSDSDFNVDDSDSEYGRKKRRGPVPSKRGRRAGVSSRALGAPIGRKQPYYHHKSKSKDQVVLLMGNAKPLATKQINAHQLEAIAATMGSSPVTVNWLLLNYETSEGNSLPRALMYGHYLRHCAELRLDPVNAASFGKLIRSVFVGLTTRRLGTRGNSKYHYCGIRIKDTSTLLLEDPDLSKKTRSNGKRSKKQQILAMQGVGICGLGGNKGLTLDLDSGGKIDFKSVRKYLGSRSTCFPTIDLNWKLDIPEGISQQDLMYFFDIYKKHCWEMMEAMELFQLQNLVGVWNRFWQQGWCELNNSPVGIPKDALLVITKIPDVQYAMQHWDGFTYDQLLSILMPNVIAQVPFQLLEEYHKFILTLREGLKSALISFEPDFVQLKLQLLDSFIDELKSWISLNLSAQAARDSMHSPNSIAQLLSDLNRINFRSVLMDVKEYVNVDEMDINVHESLKRILSGPDSIEPWSVWLVGLVEQRLGLSTTVRAAPDGASTLTAVKKECQDLSLRWLKYMSQLKLELLLRSSGSLATFLSLELLFSNFLLHLIKVYKSRALQVPLVLYSIVRKSEGRDHQGPSVKRLSQNVSYEMKLVDHSTTLIPLVSIKTEQSDNTPSPFQTTDAIPGNQFAAPAPATSEPENVPFPTLTSIKDEAFDPVDDIPDLELAQILLASLQTKSEPDNNTAVFITSDPEPETASTEETVDTSTLNGVTAMRPEVLSDRE